MLHEYGFIYSRFVRYIFQLIFFVLFWNLFSKFFISEKFNKNLWLYLLAVLVGVSVEPLNLITFIALLIITIFSLLTKRFHNSIFSSQYFIIIGSFLTGFLLFYLNPNFWSVATERGIISCAKVCSTLVSEFSAFNVSYFYFIIKENVFYLVFIAILLAILIKIYMKSRDEYDIKVGVISIALLVGILLFNYILILPGRSFYDGVNFWIYSVDIKTDTTFVLLMIVIVLSSYILSRLEINTRKFYLLLLILLVMFKIPSYGKIQFNDYFTSRNHDYALREKMYEAEKMYRFYNLKNCKEAYLPVSAISNEDLLFVFDRNLNSKLSESIRTAEFPKNYYSNIYDEPNESSIKVKFINDITAFKHFHKSGGTFTQKELAELKFTKLLDKNFVLGK